MPKVKLTLISHPRAAMVLLEKNVPFEKPGR